MKIISAFILIAFAATAQDRMAETLRKGVVEEETRQDLNAAIKSYESALTQFGQIRKLSAGDRKTAASALFRMAECYRKQGRTDQAATAYRRLLKEFGDQGPLVAQSRTRLSVQASVPDPATARKEYRRLLERALMTAKSQWDFVMKQYTLGAISELDTYAAQRQVTERQRQLAAFDAGLIPLSPAAPARNTTAEARRRYRQLLEQEIQWADREYAAKKTQYNLGAVDLEYLVEAENKFIELKLELAAFDATQGPSRGRR